MYVFRNRKLWTVVCLLLAMTLLIGACGDDDDDGGEGDAGANLTQEEFCPEIARIVCTNLFSCCTSTEVQWVFDAQISATEEDCLQDMEISCDRSWAYYRDAMAAGTATLDEDQANACLNQLTAKTVIREMQVDGETVEMEEVECVEVIPAEEYESACDGAFEDWFTGNVEPGGDCFPPDDFYEADDVECVEGSFCDEETYTCVAYLGLGDECPSIDGVRCGDDLHCAYDLDADDNFCVADLAAGEDCSDIWDECEEGLYCDTFGNPNAEPPVDPSLLCTVLKADGEACSDSDDGECDNECLPGTCGDQVTDCWTDADCVATCDPADTECVEECDPGSVCGFPPTLPVRLEKCLFSLEFTSMFNWFFGGEGPRI
jgi:hypothetical protein